MAGSFIEISANTPEITAALRELQGAIQDLTPAFRDIGEAMLNSTRKRFEDSVAPDGSAWAPLSEATLIGRARRASGGHLTDRRYNKEQRWTKSAAMAYAFAKPLIDRGHLMGTLNYQATAREVRIGTPLIYGATHQFGRGAIPARPFLGLSQSDEQELLDILNEHLGRAMSG